VVNWSGSLKVDLTPWPALPEFQARVAARPKVHAALKAEHLVKDPAPAVG
jgi:glutathione S-transferase